MALRSGHGNGAGRPHVEVCPVDELPEGVPADTGPTRPGDRTASGRFAPGNAVAAAGGRARAGRTRLAAQLGLTALAADAAFRPYADEADRFRAVQCAELARNVGGGRCGAAPSSIVATAALQLAASRYLFDRGGATGDAEMMVQASKLANDSRQNLLAAHELCAREAKARPRAAVDPLAAWMPKKTLAASGDGGGSDTR